MLKARQQKRAVITGIGVLAANGIGKDEFWSSLVAGRSGIGPITLCDVSELPCRIAGEVKDFQPGKYLNGRFKAKRLSRNVQLAVAATRLALEDAGLDQAALRQAAPIQIEIGISMGGFDFIERQIRRIVAKGMNTMLPTVVGCIHIAAASTIADLLEVPARIDTLSNSCTGGLDAIAEAAELIRAGIVEIALAGGSDAPIETSLMSGFCAARMLSLHNADPAKASRPFDLHRDGGVLAEGCGMVVLESWDHAVARGCQPYLEILGYGTARDSTAEYGSGLLLTMQQSLANAGTAPGEIDYISAHGPSDVVIDRVETDAVKRIFNARAYRLPVSSIKGVTGNPLAAAGALQVVACALTFRNSIIPPTANYETPDPLCDLDYVPARARRANVTCALINSHGIGCINSSLVVKKITSL